MEESNVRVLCVCVPVLLCMLCAVYVVADDGSWWEEETQGGKGTNLAGLFVTENYRIMQWQSCTRVLMSIVQ